MKNVLFCCYVLFDVIFCFFFFKTVCILLLYFFKLIIIIYILFSSCISGIMVLTLCLVIEELLVDFCLKKGLLYPYSIVLYSLLLHNCHIKLVLTIWVFHLPLFHFICLFLCLLILLF